MNRNAPRCILGVVVVAVFLAITWSTTAARLSNTTNSTAVEAAATLDPASPSAGGAILIDSAPNVRLEAIQDPVSQDPVSSSGMSPLAKAAGNLDQARNGSATSPTTPIDWVNGNAGASNSHYREGYSIPYRLVLTNLAPGPHNVKIEWDIRNNGKNAIDYITHFNRLNSPNHQAVFQHPAEVIDPTGAAPGSDPSDFISGLGAPTATAIPTPSSVGSSSPGQPGNSFGLLQTAGETDMTSYLATAVSLSYDFQGSLSAASSSTRLNIDFTGSGTVVFAWGGHIASQGDWGAGNSASAVSGSPYHTRLISLDGAGGNQDRSLSAAAVIVDCATCTVDSGPASVQCGSTGNTYTSTIDTSGGKVCDSPVHNWSISGDGTITGTNGATVTVTAHNVCSGSYTITDTVTCSGCTGTSTFACQTKTVTVVDNTPPVVVKTSIAACFPSVALAEAAAIAATSATDNCNAVTLSASTSGTCSAIVRVTATDTCGNAAFVDYNTRIDGTPPTLTKGSIAACFNSAADAEAAALAATAATDNCSVVLKGASTAGTCSAVITVTGTDSCGNASSVTYNASIDSTAPEITGVGGPQTIECPATPVFSEPTASDTCGTPTLSHQDVDTPGSACATDHIVRTVTRTWTATDGCGHTSTASQTITVRDTTAPTISGVGGPQTIECPAAAVFSEPTASDTCGTATLSHQDVDTPGSACATDHIVRTITRTWTAADGCGNSSTASQTITVRDTTAPTISGVGGPQTIECPTAPVFSEPTASDTCGTATLSHQDVDTPGSACATDHIVRTVTRTWTATDGCGNSSTASQTITVRDTAAPTIADLPAPTAIECPATPSFAQAQATDACDQTVTLTFNDVTTPGSCPGNYSVTRTWTAADDCGNSSQKSQTINVQDTTPPVLTCPGDVTVTCLADVQNVPINATATDNCGTVTIDHSDSTTDISTCGEGCGGKVLRTYTAVDQCGNSATPCTQTITYGTPHSAQSAQQLLIADLLKSGDVVVGVSGSRSLTIPGGLNANSSAQCVVSKLSSGGSAGSLPDSGDKRLDPATCQTSSSLDQEDGTWRSALVSQAILLSLNVRLDAQRQIQRLEQRAKAGGSGSTQRGDRPDADFDLAAFILSSTFVTQGALPGADGVLGTSDDELDPSSARLQFVFPASVLAALGANSTAADLLKLVNAALAGQSTGDVSLSDITAAVDAINRGFDFGRRRLVASSPASAK